MEKKKMETKRFVLPKKAVDPVIDVVGTVRNPRSRMAVYFDFPQGRKGEYVEKHILISGRTAKILYEGGMRAMGVAIDRIERIDL